MAGPSIDEQSGILLLVEQREFLGVVVHGDLDAQSARVEPDLAADEPHPVDIDVGVGRDPGHARADAESCRGGGRWLS